MVLLVLIFFVWCVHNDTGHDVQTAGFVEIVRISCELFLQCTVAVDAEVYAEVYVSFCEFRRS